MMSSESVFSSDDSVSAEYGKRNPVSNTPVCSELWSQRPSPVPSCMSMKSNQSMEPPNSFSKNSSDGDSTLQRIHVSTPQKGPVCKARFRHACVCNEMCRVRTHNRMHAQQCTCCGGSVTPCCKQQVGTQNLSTAPGHYPAQPVEEDCLLRGNRSIWLFLILSVVFMLACGITTVMYLIISLQMQEKKIEELRLMLRTSEAEKSKPEENYSFIFTEKLCVFIILVLLIVSVGNLHASKTHVSKQDSRSTQQEPEKTQDMSSLEFLMTDEMKLEKIVKQRKM